MNNFAATSISIRSFAGPERLSHEPLSSGGPAEGTGNSRSRIFAYPSPFRKGRNPDLRQELSRPSLFDCIDRLRIHPGRTAVAAHSPPCFPQNDVEGLTCSNSSMVGPERRALAVSVIRSEQRHGPAQLGRLPARRPWVRKRSEARRSTPLSNHHASMPVIGLSLWNEEILSC